MRIGLNATDSRNQFLINYYKSMFLRMKPINQANLNQQNEVIVCILEELNSTLDLYYESPECEKSTIEQLK